MNTGHIHAVIIPHRQEGIGETFIFQEEGVPDGSLAIVMIGIEDTLGLALGHFLGLLLPAVAGVGITTEVGGDGLVLYQDLHHHHGDADRPYMIHARVRVMPVTESALLPPPDHLGLALLQDPLRPLPDLLYDPCHTPVLRYEEVIAGTDLYLLIGGIGEEQVAEGADAHPLILEQTLMKERLNVKEAVAAASAVTE